MNEQRLVEQFFQFGISFSELRLEMFNKARPQNITPLQFEILLHIHCNPNVMVSEISAALGIVAPNTSREVKKLLEISHLERTQNSEDKRKSGICLTVVGEQVIEKFHCDLGALIIQRFQGRSESDILEIIKSLEKLNRLLV